MSSVVSRDDVEAVLWKAGIKPPHIDRVLKVIDTYVVSHAHNYADPADLLPAEPWAHLSPGAWDAKARVTRCYECGKVKSWKGNYDKDLSHPSSFNDVCKVCMETAKPAPPRLRTKAGNRQYRCRHCGEDKDLPEFPEAKRLNPSINSWCSECYSAADDDREFKCRSCNRNRKTGDFPPEKRENPRLPYSCNECIGKYGWRGIRQRAIQRLGGSWDSLMWDDCCRVCED